MRSKEYAVKRIFVASRLYAIQLLFRTSGDCGARVDAIQKAGGNSSYEFQIPQAAKALKQGFGRLIRATTDRSVLALLDNRITNQRYGRVFFDSLPPYRFTAKLEDVEEFFHV